MLLRQLTQRGLNGVKLVIADAHAGLAAAVRHHLPEAKLQRCVVHLQRNAFTQTPWRLRGRLATAITNIFAAPTIVEAKKRLEALRVGLGSELPEAMATLEQPNSTFSQRPTGAASRRRMALNGSTAKSNAARGRWEHFQTAPALFGSSPRSPYR